MTNIISEVRTRLDEYIGFVVDTGIPVLVDDYKAIYASNVPSDLKYQLDLKQKGILYLIC